MKTKIFKPLILSVIMIGTSSFMIGQKRDPRPSHRTESIEKVSTFSGVVSEWTYNDNFVYDGFYLQTGTDKFYVKFPGHMGQEMRNSISKGNITVNGVINYSPLGEKEIRFTSITSNGKTIYDIPRERPIEPPVEKYVSNSGEIIQFQQNDRGDTTGLILNNKVILRLSPHKMLQLSSLVKVGDVVTFTGLEKPKNEGEAYAENYSIIKCNTITINGEEYFVK